MAKKSTVIAHLPTSVEVTRRTSQNSLRVDVKISDSKKGTLNISQGSVEWWPDGNKVNAHRTDWGKFAEVMEAYLPKRRSTRKRRISPAAPVTAEHLPNPNKQAGSKKAWVTIHKLRALALRAAMAGEPRPTQLVNGKTVTDKQWNDALAKAAKSSAARPAK